jgi:hypothetical protein
LFSAVQHVSVKIALALLISLVFSKMNEAGAVKKLGLIAIQTAKTPTS